MPQKVLIATLALLLSATCASAGTVGDPTAGVEAGSFSQGISGLGAFNPAGSPGTPGVIGLYNDIGAFITQLVLSTAINPGLSNSLIGSSFGCNSATTVGAPNPFFLNCSVAYNSLNGGLTIRFFGVNPSAGDEPDGNDDEVGEHEGIPPLLPGCLATPDSQSCDDVGHFALVFNNDYLRGTDPNSPPLVNGWTDPNNFGPNGVLGTQVPTFNPPVVNPVPEPSAPLLSLAGAAAILFLRRKKGTGGTIR